VHNLSMAPSIPEDYLLFRWLKGVYMPGVSRNAVVGVVATAVVC
jgi:hypothetical protein